MKSHKFPTLYKVAKEGQTQQWDMEVKELPDGTAEYTATYGQKDGKKQDATVAIATGKNLGKKNETTPYEQAFSEAGAKWLKQKDKGYGETEGYVPTIRKPMLATDYGKYREKKEVEFPAFIQPKLDGIRCLAYLENNDITLLSRNGKPHELPHLKMVLTPLFDEYPNVVLDGELYLHGTPFQTIASWVKRLQPATANVEYHVYDIVHGSPFSGRWSILKKAIDHAGGRTVKEVPTKKVHSYEEVTEVHDEFKSLGYEGAMLRVGECNYIEGFRSKELLKVKCFADSEFEIVDVKDGKGKCAGQAIFTCKTALGDEFDAKPMGTDEYRQEAFNNKKDYIGKMLTVRYFEMTEGDNPVPRFPIGVAVRDYE